MQLCRGFPELSEEELRTIVEKDWLRNYQNTAHTKEELYAALQDWIDSDLPIGFYDDVIFIGRPLGGGRFEFHSMNGSDIRTLLRGTRMLFADLCGKFSHAVTYYDNPRVEAFAKHLHYPFRTEEVNEGPFRRFATTFDLRS